MLVLLDSSGKYSSWARSIRELREMGVEATTGGGGGATVIVVVVFVIVGPIEVFSDEEEIEVVRVRGDVMLVLLSGVGTDVDSFRVFRPTDG